MKHLLIVGTILLSILSCQNDSISTPGASSGISGKLPKANGQAGVLLVSIDNSLWQGEIEAIFNEKFMDTAQGPYIYVEHVFDFVQEDPSTINNIRKKNRNFLRIILETEEEYEQTEVLVKNDFKAANQLYVVIRDSNKDRLTAFLDKELKTYIALYDLEETERLVNSYAADPNNSFDQVAQEKFGISISVPSSADFKANQDSIIYALDRHVDETTRDNPNTGAKGGTYWSQKGILIWSSSYLGEESMAPMSILGTRDTTLKYNVKGTVEGSYMATELAQSRRPKFEYFDFNGNSAVKIEGLWKHDGNPAASGGGPFVQYSIVHPTRGTVVHISTHVFAPRFNKREYIREIRAMLQTIVMVD